MRALKTENSYWLRLFFAHFVLCLFFTFPAFALDRVTLQLKGGDRVTGSVLLQTTNSIVLSNSWSPRLSFLLAEVEKKTLLTNAPPTVAATNTATSAPKVAIATPPSPSSNPPKPGAIPPTHPRYWHGDISLGADLTFNSKNRQLYYGRTKLTYARDVTVFNRTLKHFKNVFDVNMAYGRTEGILSDDRLETSDKTDLDLGRKIFVYNLVSGGYDSIRKIDSRYEVGPGLGYHIFNTNGMVLNGEFGANYQVRNFSNQTMDQKFFFRFAEDFTWKISDKLSFDEKLEVFARAETWGEYRLRYESNLRYLLLKNLTLNLTLIDLYDTVPAAGVTKNDLQIRTSVGVTF